MNILKGKSTRTKIFTVITILVVVLTIALTLVLNYVGMQNTLSSTLPMRDSIRLPT